MTLTHTDATAVADRAIDLFLEDLTVHLIAPQATEEWIADAKRRAVEQAVRDAAREP